MLRFFVTFSIFVLTIVINGQPSFGPSHAFSTSTIKYSKDFTHLDYVTLDAPKTGELRLASQGSFNNLNPFIIAGVQASGLDWCYETLGVNVYDESNTVYGLLAETFEYDKIQNTFRVVLRKEAKFQNQTPVTADDVAATFQTLRQQGHPVYQQIFRAVDTVQTPDSHVVVFKMKNSDYSDDLIYNLAKIPVLSKADLSKRDFDKTTTTPLLTSGPYEIEQFILGQEIKYRQRADYWGTNLPINRGRNNFKHIVYKYFKDQNIALTAFKAHQYDWRSENIAKFWKTQYQGEAFEEGSIITEQIKNNSPSIMQAFAMNLRKPVFQDIAVRKALNLAFDFEWLNQNIFYHSYTRSDSFFPHSIFTAQFPIDAHEQRVLSTFANQLPKSLWKSHFEFSEQGHYERLVTAQNILDASDWQLQGTQRVHQKTGQSLSFTLLITSPSMKRVALPYQRHLEKLGIRMRIHLISPSNWIARIKQFDFDMTTLSWSMPHNPGSQPYLYWHSSQAEIPGSNNIIGLANPIIDHITTEIRQTENHEDRIAHMQALDRILMWNHTVIPHWYIDYDRIAYWRNISPPRMHPEYGVDLASWYHHA